MRWLISLLLASSATAANWPEPAAQFQKVHTQILTNAPVAAWRADLEKLCRPTGEDILTKSVRQVSRVWLARLQRQDLDAALRDYYRHHASYPVSLEKLDPSTLRTDPWGDPWAYRLCAPAHFSKLTSQSYKVAPQRFPDLKPLSEAIAAKPPSLPAWKIQRREVGGKPALQIGSALIQAGATIDGYTFVHISDHWALLAGMDYLVEVEF